MRRLRILLRDCKIIENLLSTAWSVLRKRVYRIPRSRSLTNWNDASTASGLLLVARSLNVLSAVAIACTLLRSCWRRTFWAHVMWHDFELMSHHMWLFETITGSCVYRYLVNHSNVLFCWRLNQTHRISKGSASTYFRWSGYFMHILLLKVYSVKFLPILIEIS